MFAKSSAFFGFSEKYRGVRTTYFRCNSKNVESELYMRGVRTIYF